MTPKTKGGVRTVRLHAPETAKLINSSMVLRHIGIAISDTAERERLDKLAAEVDAVAAKYTEEPKKKEAQGELPLDKAKK